MERYGNPNYNNYSASTETKLLKYGNPNYNNREQSEQTCMDRYGVSNVAKLSDVMEKAMTNMISTNIEKYGVPYQTLRHFSTNSEYSSCNEALLQKMADYGLQIDDREFILGKYRYDFKIWNTLIEVDPFPYHNSTWHPYHEEPISKSYHKNKSDNATVSGYRCIHIFDWDNTDKILNLLAMKDTVYARKCSIKEIDKKQSFDFVNRYHLQGDAKDKARVALFLEGEMVSVMTFGKPRYNKNYEWELIRYCSSKKVIGGSQKLFNYFVKKYKPNSMISYCDFSKFDGHTYRNLGFILKGVKISKHWYNPKTGQHIFDSLLRQLGFDKLFGTNYGKGSSNRELMIEHGFVEIYDAGQAKYIIEKFE